MRRGPVFALLSAAAITLVVALILIAQNEDESRVRAVLESRQVRNWFLPLATMEEAKKLYIYWGEGVSRYDSARVVHSVLDLDHAPEYINSLSDQKFRGLSLDCCAVMVFPPFAHGFPVYGPDSAEARRLTRFVAQGNTMIVTGGYTDVLFLNAYFGYHLESIDGVYSDGPFIRRYERLPAALQGVYFPPKLHQVFTQATVVARSSLPFPSTILYDDLTAGTPVFILKYCMINNPKAGEPPLRVNPASCDRWKKKNNPCGCGNIIYVGFDYRDMQEKDWNLLLRNLVNFAQHPPQPKEKAVDSPAAVKKAPAKKSKTSSKKRAEQRKKTAKKTKASKKQAAKKKKKSNNKSVTKKIEKQSKKKRQTPKSAPRKQKKKPSSARRSARGSEGLQQITPNDRDWEIVIKQGPLQPVLVPVQPADAKNSNGK